MLKKLSALLCAAVLIQGTPALAAPSLLPIGQTAEKDKSTDLYDPRGKSLDELTGRREELKDVQSSLGATTTAEQQLSDAAAQLQVTYGRLLDRLASSKRDADDLAALTATPVPPIGEGPFPFSDYEEQRDVRDDLTSRGELIAQQQETATHALSNAKAATTKAEETYRSYRDDHRNPSGDDLLILNALSMNVEEARAEVALWTAAGSALDSESKKLQLLTSRQNDRLKALAEKIDRSPQSLNSYFAPKIQQAEEAVSQLNKEASKLEAQLSGLETPTATGNRALDDAAAGKAAQQRAELDNRLTLSREKLAAALKTKELLELRRDFFSGENKNKDNLHAIVENLKKDEQAQSNSLENAQKAQAALRSRIATLAQAEARAAGGEKKLLQDTLASLQRQQDDTAERAAVTLELRDLTRRALEEYKGSYDASPVAEKVAGLWKEKTRRVLNTELWSTADYTVRLKSLLAALVLLILGIGLSHRIVNAIMRRLQKRTRIDATTASLLNRFLFYAFIFACFLIALNLVNIPLTAFAFLGGAFAIAIGFGAQNLFNNLISGIILAVNRPFRLGDTVEIDGVTAVVQNIGNRATKLRTFDGKDVIMPNSKIMDSRLINWSLSDQQVRGQIDIGLSYDCNPETARDVMMSIIKSHPAVLANPEPFILFTSFGDNSLNFSLYFWVDMRQAGAVVVASDLRYAIFKALAEKGISIPYPQMDLHVVSGLHPQSPDAAQNQTKN